MKLFLITLILAPFLVFSQTSIVQDKSGETSLLFGMNKTVLFSAADASIGTNLSFLKTDGSVEKFWGFNLKLKSNEGVSKLLDGYDFRPKFEFGLFKGQYIKGSPKSKSTYYYYGFALNNSYFNLLNHPGSNALSSENFLGWRVKGGINHLGGLGSTSTLFGLSMEYGEYNNLEDLTDVDKYDARADTTTIINTIVLSKKKSGFTGNYIENDMLKVNIDYLIYPQFANKRVAIGAYYRGMFGAKLGKQNLGVGFFLAQDKAPDKIVFGIVYQLNDIFNQQKEQSNFQKRTGINLMAGYNF